MSCRRSNLVTIISTTMTPPRVAWLCSNLVQSHVTLQMFKVKVTESKSQSQSHRVKVTESKSQSQSHKVKVTESKSQSQSHKVKVKVTSLSNVSAAKRYNTAMNRFSDFKLGIVSYLIEHDDTGWHNPSDATDCKIQKYFDILNCKLFRRGSRVC